MIHFQRNLVINAGVEAVWEELSRFMYINEFAPLVKSVEALTDGENGVGSKRRCHFEDGGSVAEEIVDWNENKNYRVLLSETEPMALKRAYAEIAIEAKGSAETNVVWSMDYQVKYGPLGWLMGQTMMKMMMGKVLDANLKGLADKVQSRQLVSAYAA